MKRQFIETKYEGELIIPNEVVEKLPTNIILSMPVQFLGFQDQIVAQLEKAGKQVTLFQSRHGKYPGQILGCDILKIPNPLITTVDAFFYIGDGKFHPTALLYENELPVHCYNPFNDFFETLTSDYFINLNKKKKGLLVKFLTKENIGVLVTTKSGQNQSKKLESLRTKLEREGKNTFIFLADEINLSSLENFNFIDVWINTACPRIVQDFNSLNMEDLRLINF